MENNDFQKDVNNVENNVKQVNDNVQKESKKGKTKTIILMVIVLVLVLVVGILGGLLISGNGNKVTNIINQGTEKKDENKSSKKVDESKAWVYDADYGKEKDNKTIDDINSSSELKVPFININSEDAKKANEEIKQLYERKYSEFGIQNSYGAKVTCSLEYKYYENNSILSVVIQERNAVINGGAGRCPMHIYNFNLDTLNKASNDDLAKKCGFNSISEVEEKISKWNKRQKDFEKNYPDKIAGTYDNVVNDLYFIDKDGKLNFVYISVAAGSYYTPAVVEKDKDIIDFYEIENNTNVVSYFEQNKNLNYTSNPKDNINGKVAIIKMGEKTFQTTTHDGYYTYTDNFGNSYNIKEITNITSEYRMTSNDGATNLFRAVIEYIDNNNAKKSFDTAVFVPNDANNYITLSIFGPYENYTGSTSFVRSFTDLYDDANEKLPNGTSKIIKQLSPSGWAGSSMQEVRLYDNGDVYHVVYNGDGNTEENVISFKLIARNADTIEEQMNGQAVEKIIVKGKNLTKISDDGQLWIVFENN